MIPVKVQCECGQRYAFEVEPVNRRMPAPIKCPVCGADGTTAANELIAQALASLPATAPRVAPAISIAPPPGQSYVPPPAPSGGLRLNVAATQAPAPAATPPPIPASALHPAAARPQLMRPIQKKQTGGKDGWATPETSFNKLGSYIVIGPGALAALVTAGFMGIEIPDMILCIVVAVCGVIGGVINIMGRGPIVAGAFVGLFMALGGYATAYWWIKGRESVYTIEATIAFVLGCVPGFLLQIGLQKFLQKRSRSAA